MWISNVLSFYRISQNEPASLGIRNVCKGPGSLKIGFCHCSQKSESAGCRPGRNRLVNGRLCSRFATSLMSHVRETEIGRCIIKLLQDIFCGNCWNVRDPPSEGNRGPDRLKPMQKPHPQRGTVFPENSKLPRLMRDRTIRNMPQQSHLFFRNRKKPTLNITMSEFGLAIEPVIEIFHVGAENETVMDIHRLRDSWLTVEIPWSPKIEQQIPLGIASNFPKTKAEMPK